MFQKAIQPGFIRLEPDSVIFAGNLADTKSALVQLVLECHQNEGGYSSNDLKLFKLFDLVEVTSKRVKSLAPVTPVSDKTCNETDDASLLRIATAYHNETIDEQALRFLISAMLTSEYACELLREEFFSSPLIEALVYIAFNYRRIAYDYNY